MVEKRQKIIEPAAKPAIPPIIVAIALTRPPTGIVKFQAIYMPIKARTMISKLNKVRNRFLLHLDSLCKQNPTPTIAQFLETS